MADIFGLTNALENHVEIRLFKNLNTINIMNVYVNFFFFFRCFTCFLFFFDILLILLVYHCCVGRPGYLRIWEDVIRDVDMYINTDFIIGI